jgi:hypothetical protein
MSFGDVNEQLNIFYICIKAGKPSRYCLMAFSFFYAVRFALLD